MLEFSSIILDFTEGESMVLGAPVETEGPPESEPISMPNAGDDITMEITLPDGIRRFTSAVTKVVSEPPAIRVEWPSTAERIQRRDFVRIDCLLNTEVTFVASESADERTIDARTTDVSGGGARLSMSEAPEPETRIELRVEFSKNLSRDFAARVVRTGEIEEGQTRNQFWVAVEFLDMTEARRNEIARFIFDREREQRRKGVA